MILLKFDDYDHYLLWAKQVIDEHNENLKLLAEEKTKEYMGQENVRITYGDIYLNIEWGYGLMYNYTTCRPKVKNHSFELLLKNNTP